MSLDVIHSYGYSVWDFNVTDVEVLKISEYISQMSLDLTLSNRYSLSD